MTNSFSQMLVERVSKAIGCEIVPRWRMLRLQQSAYMRRLFDLFEIDCVFDVGANTGQYRDYLRQQLGYDGLIVSFEPHPECCAQLRARAATDPLWSINEFALGAVPGRLQFNMTTDTQYSSFLRPDNSLVPAIASTNQIVRGVDVDVRTLDAAYRDVWASRGFKRPFLKIDTQGYDLNVVRGGAGVVSNFCFIQTEISNVAIYAGIPGMRETLEFFDHNGWELGRLFPTNPEQFPLTIDFDGYFVSREHLKRLP